MAYDYLKTQIRSKISVSEEAKSAGAKQYYRPTEAEMKRGDDKEKQENLVELWKNIGTATDETSRQNNIDAVIMAANQGKGADDDKVVDIIFETDGRVTFKHSDSDNDFSTTGPVGTDATAWMNLGTEIFGVMGADDMKNILGGVTTIDPTGLRGMSSGRAGAPEFEETEKEAFIRYNKTESPNAALFNTDRFVVGDEDEAAKNVRAMISSLGLSDEIKVTIPFTPGYDVITLEDADGNEMNRLDLDEYNSTEFGEFRDYILSLGADAVEDLFNETYDYRKTQKKEVSSTTPPKKDRSIYNKNKP